jgi:outer membrane PBP1 activator LpoA protein
MRWPRRLSVCVLAVTFALSGVAASACVEKPVSIASSAAASATAHDLGAAASHADHQHHGDLASADAEHDQAPAHDHDSALLKCCSLCTVVSATPVPAATATPFAQGAVLVIGPLQRDLVGSILSVDPGIPKRIV